jgi:hypothetical protein
MGRQSLLRVSWMIFVSGVEEEEKKEQLVAWWLPWSRETGSLSRKLIWVSSGRPTARNLPWQPRPWSGLLLS